MFLEKLDFFNLIALKPSHQMQQIQKDSWPSSGNFIYRLVNEPRYQGDFIVLSSIVSVYFCNYMDWGIFPTMFFFGSFFKVHNEPIFLHDFIHRTILKYDKIAQCFKRTDKRGKENCRPVNIFSNLLRFQRGWYIIS